MNDDFKVIMAVIAGFLLFVFLVFAIGNIAATKKCETKWAGSNPSYTYWGGYKILKDGKMIPADMMREVQ